MGTTWVDVPDWPNYEVSDKGQVRNKTTGHIKKASNAGGERGGRPMVGLSDRANGRSTRMWVHHIVAFAFLGPRPEGLDIRHINGDRFDNRAENLEYCTRKENLHDMVRHGTIMRGDRHYNAKITEADIPAIRRLILGGMTYKTIADKYNVSTTAIADIKLGRSWRWL